MLEGADIRGYGRNLPPPAEKESASLLFVGISTGLMIAVNVRIFGTIWAVLMVALCMAILFLGRRGMLRRWLKQPILFLLPSLFVLSCLWSDAFMKSLSLGLQTLLTTLTAITIAQCTSNRQFLLIIFMATSIVCIGCILHGGRGPSAEGDVLIGFLGSKDAMGLFAYSGVMAALAVMLDSVTSFKLRIVALVMLLVEAKLATSVHATAAIIALGLGITIFLGTHIVLSRSKLARLAFYFCVLFIIIAVVCVGSELLRLFLDIAQSHFGKDPTLTGRTVLWEKAMQLFEQRPLLGHGYRAFWVGTSLEARELLFMMNVEDGRGFHFHEQFLEVLADTGVVGFTVLITTLVIFAQRIWRNVIRLPSAFTAYSFALLVVYDIRLVLETAFLPFSFDMMMIYGLAAAAMKPFVTKVTPPEAPLPTQ